MKNIRVFLSENFQFLEVKFSLYLNRHVFVMISQIHPSELQLNKANLSETKPRFWICICLFQMGLFHAKFMINAMIFFFILRL